MQAGSVRRNISKDQLKAEDKYAHEKLKATGLPVLVTHGEADDAWMPHVQADMAERLGARYEVIEDAIHSPAVENPPKTVAVLCSFWGSVTA